MLRPCSIYLILCLVLVQHRKTHPNITEKVLTVTPRIKQKKPKRMIYKEIDLRLHMSI